MAIDKAQQIQPFRPLAVFNELADALNGAQEAQECNVAPTAAASADRSPSPSRVLSFPLPAATSHVVYVSPKGCDFKGTGSAAAPLRSLEAALASVRASRATLGLSAVAAPQAFLILRAGTFYQSQTLKLTREDSRVTFQAYPNEAVFFSGGVALGDVAWSQVAPPARAVWEYRAGTLDDGFDASPPATMTPAAAQVLCAASPPCNAIAYDGSVDPTSPALISFKYKTFYAAGAGNVWVLNRGYLPNADNLYVADLSALNLPEDIDGVRVDGTRAIRARYPNAVTVGKWHGRRARSVRRGAIPHAKRETWCNSSREARDAAQFFTRSARRGSILHARRLAPYPPPPPPLRGS